jgi:hypothetical protein
VLGPNDVARYNDALLIEQLHAPSRPDSARILDDAGVRRAGPRLLTTVSVLVVGALWIVLLLEMRVSLKWRLEHDAALLHYAAFLMDHEGRVPYKDIFETSMPGTFAVHYAIGHFLGFDAAPFRRVDLVVLTILLALTWAFMRRFGDLPALAAPALFALFYLSLGQEHSLQRDYLGILPIAAALTLQPTASARVAPWKFAATGLFLGLSSLFKPHLAIGLPVLFWALARGSRPAAPAMLRQAAWCAAGFLVPWIVAAVWLWRYGALSAFVDMAVHYLPLHNALNAEFVVLPRGEYTRYWMERALKFGGYRVVLVTAAAGLGYAWWMHGRKSARGASVTLVAALLAVYIWYPAIGGKFWSYHYLPTLYVLSLASALCVMRAEPGKPLAVRRAAIAAVVIAVALAAGDISSFTRGVLAGLRADYRAPSPKFGRVDAVGAWLSQHAAPGDVAQPLDWNGGMLHAMLVARVPIATSFTYDYHFYHHVSSPVIQELRRRFMRELQASSPRFILQVTARKPFVSGVDTTVQFPSLTDFLRDYQVVARGDGYSIFERRAAQ